MNALDAWSPFAERASLTGHRALPLDDAAVRLVVAGAVEIYCIAVDAPGRRQFLFSAQAGDLLLPAAAAARKHGLQLLALGQDAELCALPLAEFLQLPAEASTCASVERWCESMGGLPDLALPAIRFQPLVPGETRALRLDEVCYPQGGICWVECTAGAADFLGRPESPLAPGDLVPLSARVWLHSRSAETVVRTHATTDVLGGDHLQAALATFHDGILGQLRRQLSARREADRARLADKAALDGRVMQRSLAQMAQVAETARAADGFAGIATDAPLLAACQLVGRALGASVEAPPALRPGRQAKDPITAIAEASRLRHRHVALRGRWWRGNHGPLVAFLQDTGAPVALLQPRPDRYDLYDPATRRREPVTPDVAARLKRFGYALVASLGTAPLTPRALWSFVRRGMARDVAVLVSCGVAAGVLGMAAPILSRRLFDDVIPLAERSQLLQFTLLLGVVAIVAAGFEIVRSIALLRLEALLEVRLESAMMDRLLRLPARFFKRFQTGDLANRVLSISFIRRLLTGAALAAMLTGIFSSVNLVLLFFYDAQLALVALALAAVAAVVLALRARASLHFTRAVTHLEGKIAGLVFQLMNGVAKLRVAGAERRAFSVWAELFARQKSVAYQAGAVANHFDTFQAAFPLASSVVLFAAVYLALLPPDGAAGAAVAAAAVEPLTAGAFVAIITAFSQFLAGFLGMGQALMGVLQVIPMYERVQPLLEAVPEIPSGAEDPGALTGAFEISHVSFRYDEAGPLVLDDVSLSVGAGEMVALVGASGSGKSTLSRLLLGLDRPTAGAIFYDAQDLGRLDVAAVRRQIGVVLQKDRVQSGDVFHNIVGQGSNLTLADAWEAARLAGLEDDIKAMPMGMHTIVSEGGGTFSGGQRQRLLIARAIVHKPRLLFFDEATSALDNRTQQIVSDSLSQLRVTRVVIAHRLSTIRNADRICVLQDGRVVETGTYRELAGAGGLFATLIRRQLV